MSKQHFIDLTPEAHAKSWSDRCAIAPKDLAGAVSEAWYLEKGQKPVQQAAVTGAY